MPNNYTEFMEEDLFEEWGALDNSDDDYSKIIEHLNSKEFRTFGEGLKYLIHKKTSNDEDPIECLKRLCKEKSIDIKNELASINTIKNWFSGGERPKKSDDSRRKLFVLAFVLELTPDETAYLFQNVYLDRAFNKRNPKELIYYFCLKRHMTLKQADEMISKIIIKDSKISEQTIYTSILQEETKEIESCDEIIDYINSHPHNFSVNSKTLNEKLRYYIERAKKRVAEEIEKYGYEELLTGKNVDSINFMYEVITGQTVTSEKGTKTIFKNSYIPKEIRTSFPEAVTFSKKEPTYEEIRKMLILLFSYCFWSDMNKNNIATDIEDYRSEADALLLECGLPAIYPGNPFDWLFCFCTLNDNPLDTFRSIVCDVLNDDN